MSKPKFKIFRNSISKKFYYRLVSADKSDLLYGYGYTSKKSCLNDIRTIKKIATDDSFYEFNDKFLRYSFDIVSRNGKMLGNSSSHVSLSEREENITALKKEAGLATIEYRKTLFSFFDFPITISLTYK